MGYTKTQRARLAAGLCFRCGAIREGAGSTNCFCAGCADKSRASCRAYKVAHPEKRFYPKDLARSRVWKAKRRAERVALDVCVLCGRPKVGREMTATQCGYCTRQKKQAEATRRQRERNREAGLPEAGDISGRTARIWTMGRAVPPLGPGAHRFTCRLDRDSKEGLLLLLARYKKEARERGRDPLTHQRSRIVRECVRVWAKRPCPPRPHRLLHEERIGVWFDAQTWGILQREAERLGVSKARVLRAMVVYAGPPKRVVVARNNGWTMADYRARWRWETADKLFAEVSAP